MPKPPAHILPLSFARTIFFVGALVFPILTCNISGRENVLYIVNTVYWLYNSQDTAMVLVAAVVLLTCIIFPLLHLLGDLKWSHTSNVVAVHTNKILNFISVKNDTVKAWAMADIFLLGILISAIKLYGVSDLSINYGGFSLLMYMYLNFYISLNDKKIGALGSPDTHMRVESHFIAPCINSLRQKPSQKGSAYFSKNKDRQKNNPVSWSLLITAIILFFPANFFPMLHTTKLGSTSSHTIMGGVMDFAGANMWFLAVVVFAASFLIPILKFAGLLYLLIDKPNRSFKVKKIKHRIYHQMEIIGKWSMVDVFVVAILVAVIRMDQFASITPGVGTLFFAAMVVFTMLATMRFQFQAERKTVGHPEGESQPPEFLLSHLSITHKEL